MKKIHLLMTAIASMAVVLPSCSSSEDPMVDPVTPSAPPQITYNITVDGFSDEDASTRAFVKTSWGDGDELSIWYDSNKDATPDLTLTYSASSGKWSIAETSSNTPSTTGGYLKTVYNGVAKVAAYDSYTYEATSTNTATLTANIFTWTFLTELQVVVTGLTADDASNYSLWCNQLIPCTGYEVGESAITAQNTVAGDAVRGIANTDGVAFVFGVSAKAGESADYVFTLANRKTSEISTYTAASKTLERGNEVMKGLKIASTKFAPSYSGTAIAHVDLQKYITVNWVQLWKDGPRFAKVNYITYKDLTDTNQNDEKQLGTALPCSYWDEETAPHTWGPNWSIGASETVMSSLKNTNLITKRYYSKDGIFGFEFTGIGDYSNNSIFLPAQFSSGTTAPTATLGEGNYWSTTQIGLKIQCKSSDSWRFSWETADANRYCLVRPILAL